VLGQPRRLLVSPEIVAVTWRAAQETSDTPPAEADVARALRRLDPAWDELFPA
jgi:site-specific DNA recombinase